MEITVMIPPSVEEHLRTYAASLFYETSPYALSRAIIAALINEMNSAGLINQDEIIAGIIAASKPEVSTQQAASIVELPAPPIEKLDIDISKVIITDPMKLKIPREQFHGDTSNTWLVWGWCVSSHFNTPDNGARKLRKFRLQDVIQGVMQQKGIQIKDTTAYSALDVLVKRQWLTFIETNKRYTLSPIAQKWASMPQNQVYLTEKELLRLSEESDMIYK